MSAGPRPGKYAGLLSEYEQSLLLEEKLLAALSLTHGSHSPQYKRQRNRVETVRRQTTELRRLAAEEAQP